MKAESGQEEKNFNQAVQLAEKFQISTHHKISLEEFEKLFETNLQTGLTNEQAAAKLAKDGPNKLS